ncbi:MAG: DUF3592 domain-containing protein [Candidatus Schekmanbacteria bacterium]|nr:DUF3592 domain-containing protein [Candidatus Schekmanbacteria bacterium]
MAITASSDETSRIRPRFGLLSVTCAAAAVALVLGGVSGLSLWCRIADFQETDAEITTAELKVIGQGESGMPRRGHYGLYIVALAYAYSAGGFRHEGHADLTREVSRTQAEAQERLRAYTPGGELTVYVDPDDPAVSRLDRDVPLVLPLASAIAGLVALGAALRLAARTQPDGRTP